MKPEKTFDDAVAAIRVRRKDCQQTVRNLLRNGNAESAEMWQTAADVLLGCLYDLEVVTEDD